MPDDQRQCWRIALATLVVLASVAVVELGVAVAHTSALRNDLAALRRDLDPKLHHRHDARAEEAAARQFSDTFARTLHLALNHRDDPAALRSLDLVRDSAPTPPDRHEQAAHERLVARHREPT